MSKYARIEVDHLRRTCDPALFEFESTEELSPLDAVIGQQRAVRAVSFGIDIESPGYHMYAMGPAGTGKTTTIQKFLQRKAADRPVPDDWCYVNNFENTDKPRALRLPAGKGCEFQADVDRLVEDLQTEVPRAFESEEYQQGQERIEEEFQKRRQALFEELAQEAESKGFRLVQTQQGLVVAPVRQGNVISPDEFSQLGEAARQQLERRQQELQEKLRETMRQVQQLQKQAREDVRELDRRMVSFAVEHLINELKEAYAAFDAIVEFLEQVRADILDRVQTFKQLQQQQQAPQQMPAAMMQGAIQGMQQSLFNRYRANLIVDNCDTEGAPVVLESNPSFHNLIGRIEHQAQFGALVTDFNMIKGGALHRANGGYLMVNTRDILTKPFAWEALKRALKNKEICIETMGQEFRAIATATLEPEPIPLDVKVVLLGNPLLYYMLYNLDEDFRELFKVKADFAQRMEWSDESVEQYAQFIATICREEGLNHFAPSGVARIVEQSARMVGHKEKLATKFGEVVDLIREASYWAGTNGHDLVQADDVRQAIEEKVYRSNRMEERIREMIDEGTILIDTEGDVTGQVNGISVVPLGDYSFGKPSRITARTHVGSKGVVNIDRETKLGGRIHNKGVMILSGYLGGKYAQDEPLAFSASLTFEQLYEEVDGDSAASAELYALLSSLSDMPLRQDLAVTGSVNQRGEVQAIGGVNEKIEGFFDVCRLKGLTGEQGVVIPQSNVRHLMLREDVVEAVEAGEFHIYPVSTIDDGITLLTGVEAGQRQADGTYPDGTVNWAVQDRLQELAEKVKAFARRDGEPEVDATA